MSFTNVYYKRTAGTARACYVCYKPTTTVLATINTVDFLYTCPGHLADREFATKLGANETRSTTMTEEEIAKIKEEWEEKQRKRSEREKEKAKEKEKEKEKSEKDEAKSGVKDGDREPSQSAQVPGSLSTSPTPTPPPAHEQYALHRDYFTMRLTEHRKRKQATQAKNLAPRLPGAPSGTVMEDKY